MIGMYAPSHSAWNNDYYTLHLSVGCRFITILMCCFKWEIMAGNILHAWPFRQRHRKKIHYRKLGWTRKPAKFSVTRKGWLWKYDCFVPCFHCSGRVLTVVWAPLSCGLIKADCSSGVHDYNQFDYTNAAWPASRFSQRFCPYWQWCVMEDMKTVWIRIFEKFETKMTSSCVRKYEKKKRQTSSVYDCTVEDVENVGITFP